HAEGVRGLRQEARALHPSAGRGQRRAALSERARELASRHDPDERRDLAHGGARLARRQAHGRRLQAGRRISEDGRTLRREHSLHERVPGQERKDAADQPAEALLRISSLTVVPARAGTHIPEAGDRRITYPNSGPTTAKMRAGSSKRADEP